VLLLEDLHMADRVGRSHRTIPCELDPQKAILRTRVLLVVAKARAYIQEPEVQGDPVRLKLVGCNRNPATVIHNHCPELCHNWSLSND
jgi:hypothetical protein